jgi:CheY-like chemotaxis protein
METEGSAELELAEAVAGKTAQRLREGLREELDARDLTLRQLWRKDLGQLRDDLTSKRLLEDLKGASMDQKEGAPIRVLVVDDNPELCRAFVRIFESAGMAVSHALSGLGAAALLEGDPTIEVVVADISMPKNGYTLLEHVRKHFPIIEVVMTSGFDTEADRARQMGAFAFLPKPFNLSQARLIVERAAEFRRLKLAATSRG